MAVQRDCSFLSKAMSCGGNTMNELCSESQIKKAKDLILAEFIMFNVGITMLPTSRVYFSCLFGI